MKKIIYLSLIFSGFFLVLLPTAKAEVFTVNLSYSPANRTLSFDKTKTEEVSINKKKFVSVFDFSDESKNKIGNYIAKLYDDKGAELISGYFLVHTGSFTLDVPYISIASSLKILDKVTKEEVLSADLSKFITCNRNGICEFEKGENGINCILDCGSSSVDYSQQTKEDLDANGGVIKDPQTGEVLLENVSQENNISNNETAPSSNESEGEVNKERININNVTWWIALLVIISAIAIVAIYFILRKRKNRLIL